MFLIEHVNPGFIEQNIDQDVIKLFEDRLTLRVNGLLASLNIKTNQQGETRPYTEEGWLPLYVEVKDIIRIMKRTQLGRQMIEFGFQKQWETIEKWSQFASNRHGGMVRQHGWRTFKRLRNFEFIET